MKYTRKHSKRQFLLKLYNFSRNVIRLKLFRSPWNIPFLVVSYLEDTMICKIGYLNSKVLFGSPAWFSLIPKYFTAVQINRWHFQSVQIGFWQLRIAFSQSRLVFDNFKVPFGSLDWFLTIPKSFSAVQIGFLQFQSDFI